MLLQLVVQPQCTVYFEYKNETELLLFLALHGTVLVRKALGCLHVLGLRKAGLFEAGPVDASTDEQCSAGLKPQSCSVLHLA